MCAKIVVRFPYLYNNIYYLHVRYMTNKQKTAKLKKFLEARKSLKPGMLETEAGIPPTTIYQIFHGREFPEKHWAALEKVLKKYCWK